MLTVVMPFYAGDAHSCIALLKWMIELDGKAPDDIDCIISYDDETPTGPKEEIASLAAQFFTEVRPFLYGAPPLRGWPAAPNWAWQQVASFMVERKPHRPWLWLEADATPIKQGWLTTIHEAHRMGGKPFAGHIVEGMGHMNGVGVYPWNVAEMSSRAMLARAAPFDVVLKEIETNSVTPLNHIIQHAWNVKEDGKTIWLGDGDPVSFKTQKDVDRWLNPTTVLWHRCKDGSLIRRLMERHGKVTTPEVEPADIVSLRRNGDIIALLPLLRVMSIKRGRKIRLVVHRDYLPLLEGVSYVEPVPWDGDWEDPLAATIHYRAKNAQVYGKFLNPDRINGNFVKTAWQQAGATWDRHMPLVFDKRDAKREKNLAETVFNEPKPKLLVKLHGFSSPFKQGPLILEWIKRDFGDAFELVLLDDIKAERIYDLLGLMDRAHCLITIDTVTLHLAHASKCPVVALTNGNGFSASPPRGNSLLRIPYQLIEQMWEDVVTAVKSTLTPFDNDNIVLAYSYFKPRDEDTKRRQDRAWLSWPLLKARLFGYSGTRTSDVVGDRHSMPFVRDMIVAAMNSGEDGIIALTNNDIIFDHDLHDAVVESCRNTGCYWAYRVESPTKTTTDNGADVFAFTRRWWIMHEKLFPDFLLGYPWWDDVMVRMMRWSGCAEQPRLYYHEPHPGYGTRTNTPGHNHNERLATAWLTQHHERREKPS